ncbi:MAG: CDP-alcohol phosphatidyltransferase family protein [Acidimicrobiia bacterium]
MFDGHWRTTAERAVKPLGEGLQRIGVSADHLTATGLVMAGATAVAIGAGHPLLGAALLAGASLPDLLDGAVAKASGTASPRGAFFDSVADRVTDTLVLGGIAWYLAADRGGLAPMLPFAVLGTSSMIPYLRAKAEALGFYAKGGLMERAERLVMLMVALAFSALLVPILWLMLGLTALTAGQRFVKVWRQASAARPVPVREPRWRVRRDVAAPWRTERVERWRARRTARPVAWRDRVASGRRPRR